ncbi:hypothetical protein ACFWPV_15445, partial [Streptomyces uncialis]
DLLPKVSQQDRHQSQPAGPAEPHRPAAESSRKCPKPSMPCIVSQMTPADDGAQAMAGLEAEAQRVIATSLAQMAAAVSVLVTLHPLLPLVVRTPVPKAGATIRAARIEHTVRNETHLVRRDAALPLPGHRQPAEQQVLARTLPALTGRWGGTGRW